MSLSRPQKSVTIKISCIDLDPNIVSAILNTTPDDVVTHNRSCSWMWLSTHLAEEETQQEPSRQAMLVEALAVFEKYENLKIANPEINTSISILVGDISQIQGEENSHIIDRLRQYGDVWLDMPTGSILLNND